MAIACAVVVSLAWQAAPAAAQDALPDSSTAPSAERMIEQARETYRPPGLLSRCDPGQGNEIVVCGVNPETYRVDSSLDEAIEAGEAVEDGLPRAPDVYGGSSGGMVVMSGCMIPPCPPPYPPMIDLLALPHPLSPEEAAQIRRADPPPDP